jgi:hypothetical protein
VEKLVTERGHAIPADAPRAVRERDREIWRSVYEVEVESLKRLAKETSSPERRQNLTDEVTRGALHHSVT